MFNKQKERESLEKKYTEEYIDMKYVYETKCKDIYQKISQIVKGNQLVSTQALSPEEIQKYKLETFSEPAEAGIPHFWLGAIENSKYFYNLNNKDKEVLKFCSDVYLEILENKTVRRSNDNFLGF